MKVVLRSPSLFFLVLGIIFNLPVSKVKRKDQPEPQKTDEWDASHSPSAPPPELIWRRRT